MTLIISMSIVSNATYTFIFKIPFENFQPADPFRKYHEYWRSTLKAYTVGGTSSWTRERQFGHQYLCHF